METYCTLYIVRHGETEWNVKRLLQGQQDSPLTENGLRQAKDLGEKMKDIRFDAAFSSDATRAIRTAELITLERNMAITTTAMLRERTFGHLEGQPYTALNDNLKHMVDKYNTLADKEKKSFKYADDIESDEEIVTRFNTFLREIAIAYTGKTVLAVTHGGMIRALLYHFGYGDYTRVQKLHIKNTCYLKIDSDGVDYFIRETYGIEEPKAQ